MMVGEFLGSKKVAIFEALLSNDRTGLTTQQMARASGVPKSTVPRIVSDFGARGIIIEVGLVGKSPVYRLNRTEPKVRAVAAGLNHATAFTIEAGVKP